VSFSISSEKFEIVIAFLILAESPL
jgi:hypothetical protein